MPVPSVSRRVLGDMARSVDPAWLGSLPIEGFLVALQKLADVGRASMDHWTAHAEALEQLRAWIKANRRKSKGWRRHVRRVKAGR